MGCLAVLHLRVFAVPVQSRTVAWVLFTSCRPHCDFQELQNSLESLRSNTEKLELELNSLKKENKHLKELDACREAELHQ